MSLPLPPVAEHTSHTPAEQRVIVRNVSWTTYENLLADLANQSSLRTFLSIDVPFSQQSGE
jgi:hypothetical protein